MLSIRAAGGWAARWRLAGLQDLSLRNCVKRSHVVMWKNLLRNNHGDGPQDQMLCALAPGRRRHCARGVIREPPRKVHGEITDLRATSNRCRDGTVADHQPFVRRYVRRAEG
jgi:hypothetical protein